MRKKETYRSASSDNVTSLTKIPITRNWQRHLITLQPKSEPDHDAPEANPENEFSKQILKDAGELPFNKEGYQTFRLNLSSFADIFCGAVPMIFLDLLYCISGIMVGDLEYAEVKYKSSKKKETQ